MNRKIKWEEMLPDELLDAIAACPCCFMAYGLAEPHGAYSALGLDWLKAQALCEKAAHASGGVVAPPFCWHIQERPSFDWCPARGTPQTLCSSLPGDLWLHVVLHQLRVFDARGFHAALLITGHYGGLEQDMRLLAEYYTLRTGSPLQIRCLADWELIDYKEYRGDHAGLTETQQLMALHPELVDLARREPSPTSGKWAGTDFLGYGQLPARDEGEAIVASQVTKLGEIQSELLVAYQPSDDWQAPNQDVVEEMWSTFERLTRKYWSSSTTLNEYRAGGAPSFPGWKELGMS